MDTVLKLCAYDEPWVESKYKGDYKSVPKDERGYNSWWYLHGELEYLVGYDKAYPINCKSSGNAKETINWSEISHSKVKQLRDDGNLTRWEIHINGIIPVQVKGVDKPCVGYFWTTNEHDIEWEGKKYPYWEQRGLVCLESDSEGREDALKKFQEKTTIL